MNQKFLINLRSNYMCVKITSENFILNYFFVRNIIRASFKELEKKKLYIEDVFNKNVYIDLYKTSISATLYYNKKYLSYRRSDETIKCNLKNIIEDNVMKYVNNSLPSNIKDKYFEELRR
jgi:hypothetical protein